MVDGKEKQTSSIRSTEDANFCIFDSRSNRGVGCSSRSVGPQSFGTSRTDWSGADSCEFLAISGGILNQLVCCAESQLGDLSGQIASLVEQREKLQHYLQLLKDLQQKKAFH